MNQTAWNATKWQWQRGDDKERKRLEELCVRAAAVSEEKLWLEQDAEENELFLQALQPAAACTGGSIHDAMEKLRQLKPQCDIASDAMDNTAQVKIEAVSFRAELREQALTAARKGWTSAGVSLCQGCDALSTTRKAGSGSVHRTHGPTGDHAYAAQREVGVAPRPSTARAGA